MKKHWKWVMPIVILVLAIVCVVALKGSDDSTKEKEPTKSNSTTKNNEITKDGNVVLDTIGVPPNEVVVPEKAHIFLIENEQISLKSDDSIKVTTGKIGDKLPTDTKFVFIPHTKELTASEKEALQQYLDQKAIILFIGLGVDPQTSLDKLAIDKTATWINSNVDLYFVAYGYGYSYGYDDYIPVFFQTTVPDKDKVADALTRLAYMKRGF